MTRTRTDRWLAGTAIVAVLGFLTWRVAAHGILAIAPDDAEYIGVGRRLLAFRSPTGIDGTLFTIRSWVWPLVQGLASRLGPSDPLRGPQFLGVAFGAVALVGVVVFAYRRSGGVGAIGVAIVMMMTPVLWDVAASPRIDVALLALLVLTIVVAAEPSPRRVVAAGVIAGLAMLVKETSAPLVILPLAWWGMVPPAVWRRWLTRFLVAFGVTVGWWFVAVLVLRGEVFPLEGLHQAAVRAVPRGWTFDAASLALVAAWVVGAAGLVVTRRHEVGIRVLLLAAVAMLPATAIAWADEFALRQFAPIAMFGALIVGIAASGLLAQARTWAREVTGRRVVVGALLVVVLAAVVVPIARVGTHVTDVDTVLLDRDLAAWLDANTTGSQTVAATFRFKAQTWAQIDGRLTLEGLRFENPEHVGALGRLVWVDWVGGSFHALPRRELRRATHRARMLEISGRFRLGPAALSTWLTQFGGTVGARRVVGFGRDEDQAWIRVFALDGFRPTRIPTIVTTAAIDHLPDARVRRLGDILMAGTVPALARVTARIRAVGGTVPPSFVAFPR